MIYVRPLTDEERQELKRMRRQEVGRVSLRAQIILLSDKHWTVPQIAALLEMSRVTIRSWIDRFESWGPEGLCDEKRSGRPRKMHRAVEGTLMRWMAAAPQSVHASFLATFWTIPMLVLALLKRFHIRVCANTVRNLLHRLRLRWGRPRLAMPLKTDPKKREKQWAIVKAVVEAGPEAVVLYEDESRVQTLPLIRAMWHWIGQQPRVPTPGSNTARAIFGALNIRTGQWSYRVRDHMRKEDFIAFLEHLLVVYPTQTILVIVDNYSSHTAHLVEEWLQEHPRLHLHLLPKYCSHLNPVESIWLRMKNKIAANRLFGSIQIVLRTVDAFFARMTPEQALEWAAAA
jgi:transposase